MRAPGLYIDSRLRGTREIRGQTERAPIQFSLLEAFRFVMRLDVGRFLSLLIVAGLEEPTAAANAAGFSALSTAAGFLSITVSRVRAGASGVRRPPSQCLIASRLNPNVSENLACVMPSRFRIALTSTSWGTCALNPSCFPARKASTSLRPSIICSNCVFMLGPQVQLYAIGHQCRTDGTRPNSILPLSC